MSADPSASPQSKRFTSWKLDLLDAMASDPEVRPVDFHIAFVVMQHVNRFTQVAVISDLRLQQLVPRDREEKTPHGRRSNNKVKTPHSMKPRNEAKKPRCAKTHNGEKTPHRATEVKTPLSEPQWGENTPHSGEKMHPLHLQSPKTETLSVKNMAPEAYEAHVTAFDRWTEFKEITARLEYDERLPRHEAEHRARILCGFDDADADGRQGAGTTPPTVAKLNS